LTTQLRPWVCAVGVDGWLANFDLRSPVVPDEVNPEGTAAAAYWAEYCPEPSGDEGSAN
jgi:hypothetical protein